MSTQTAEHKKDHYAVQVDREPGCQVTLTINVSPEMTKKEYAQALKGMNKQVSLPGFRKGHAPDTLIIKHYKQHIEEDWRKALVNKAFQMATEISDTYPYTRESIKKVDIASCSLEEGCQIIAQFEAMPDTSGIDFATLVFEEVPEAPVTEQKIDQIVEDIRYRFADWKKIEDRPIQEGDFVDVDIEDLDEEGTFICRDTRLEVKKGKMGTWLVNLLIGMHSGESAEAQSTLDEGLEGVDFQPTNCRVTAKSIFESALPQLDDALAEKAGVKDAAELRSKVIADLTTLHKRQATEKRREILRTYLVENSPFDVPASLVESETQRRREQRLKESSTALSQEEVAELEKTTRKEVEEMFRWHFIVHEIAAKEQIGVAKNELATEALRYQYSQQAAGKPSRAEQPSEELMNMIYAGLLARNVVDFLITKSRWDKNSSHLVSE